MYEVLKLLNEYKLILYILLFLFSLLSIRRMSISWKELRSTIFGLEKETAQRRFNYHVSTFGFSLFALLGLFITTSIVFPDLPDTSELPTPTIQILAETTPTLNPLLQSVASPTTLAPTLVLEGGNAGCLPGQIEWTYPTNGAEVQGEVILKATIQVTNLGFYQYEYTQPGGSTWVTIAAGEKPLIDSPLGGEGSGVWDTSNLTPGDYILRLVVKDNANNEFPHCQVNFRVLPPPN